ncbi:MAG: hypothetical protein KIG48_05970 [Eubacteriales bacterium]|nr:hypothetical protein [Eubacteriales bacterium]
MKGSKFLKVTGILMIVFGALALILSIVAAIGLAALVALDLNTWQYTAAVILMLVGSIFELIAGIVGVKNCNKPEKAGTCMVWGIIVIALSVLSNVLTLVGNPDNFSIVNLLTGLVIPVLYLIGAVMNKKAA